jgi:hypothetical protein
MDGALNHNNPIRIADREWKLLWGNELCEHPDIILSLGTTYNPHSSHMPARKTVPEKPGIFAHGKSLVKLAKDHIEDSLDCEKTWRSYVSLLPPSASESRYVRYNPALMRDPPTLDDVPAMKPLQQEVRDQLSRDKYRLRGVAMQLMATSFYWETKQAQQFSNNTATVTGEIFKSPSPLGIASSH